MKNSTSLSILKAPGTSTIPQITTQPPSQQICNQFQLQPFAVTPNRALATHNKIHITMQSAQTATSTAITNSPLTSPMNQHQAITTHCCTSHPTNPNSSQYHQLQPIRQPTVCPTNKQHTDPATCSTNCTKGNCQASSHCTLPPNEETITHAPITQSKNHQLYPTPMPSPFFNCAPHSLFPKDNLNTILDLKEEVFNLNKKLNQLFSIIPLMPNIFQCDSTTKSYPSKLSSTIRDTLYTTQKLSDLYDLMTTLPPTIYNPLIHMQEIQQHTLTILPTNLQMKSSPNTYSSHSVQHYYYMESHSTGTLAALQQHLQNSTKYQKGNCHRHRVNLSLSTSQYLP